MHVLLMRIPNRCRGDRVNRRRLTTRCRRCSWRRDTWDLRPRSRNPASFNGPCINYRLNITEQILALREEHEKIGWGRKIARGGDRKPAPARIFKRSLRASSLFGPFITKLVYVQPFFSLQIFQGSRFNRFQNTGNAYRVRPRSYEFKCAFVYRTPN